MRKICLMLCLVLMSLPVFAQDEGENGRGVIRVGDAFGDAPIVSARYVYPFLCRGGGCEDLIALNFPTLMGVDYANGIYEDAVEVGNGLVRSWEVDGDIYTVTLRDDVYWSDGTPITAYDVLYSYFMAMSGEFGADYMALTHGVRAVMPIDAHTIRFVRSQETCEIGDFINIPMVLPAHSFDLNFQQIASTFFTGTDDIEAQFTAWSEGYDIWAEYHAWSSEPLVTSGAFSLDETSFSEALRYVSAHGNLALEYVRVPNQAAEVALFLRGELNLIVNPLFSRRADIRAAEARGEVRTFSSVGDTTFSLNFNLADPNNPQNAYDEYGEFIEQGVHPILGDVRVRQAIQKALDVQAIIDAAYFGEGTLTPSAVSPASWAFDPELAAIAYDPAGAVDLLESAGWIDENGDGVRECVRCQAAAEATPLMLNLAGVSAVNEQMPELIRRQLARVGIQVNFSDTLINAQNYDMALIVSREQFPINLEQLWRYSRENDVLNSYVNPNIGSYHNAEFEGLLAEATSTCDVAARTGIYHRMQAILQADPPAAWLFTLNDMVAVGSGVQGFDPLPHAPLWNIDQWVIVR